MPQLGVKDDIPQPRLNPRDMGELSTSLDSDTPSKG